MTQSDIDHGVYAPATRVDDTVHLVPKHRLNLAALDTRLRNEEFWRQTLFALVMSIAVMAGR
jgi:hypothetical protein